MSIARGEKDYLGVLKGLNTEANALAFPEGYSSDEQNFLLDPEGGVRVRRKGLQNEKGTNSYTLGTGSAVGLASKSYYWPKPDLLVTVLTSVQDDVALILNRNDSTYSFVGEYEISDSAGFGFNASFSPILNGLTITGGSGLGDPEKPVLLEYDEDSNEVNVYRIDIHFRDFHLVDDGLAVDERPNDLSDEHLYNLYNAGWRRERRVDPLDDRFRHPLVAFGPRADTWDQAVVSFQAPNRMTYENSSGQDMAVGWEITIPNASINAGTYTVTSVVNRVGGNVDYVTLTPNTIVDEATANIGAVDISYNIYPSNADIVTLGISANDQGREVFDTDTFYEVSVGTSEAPRGHYVYSLFNSRDRDYALSYPDDSNIPSTSLTLEDTIVL